MYVIYIDCPISFRQGQYPFPHLGCFILLSVVKYEERNPEPLNILEGEGILGSGFLQVEILDPVVVPSNRIRTSSTKCKSQKKSKSKEDQLNG